MSMEDAFADGGHRVRWTLPRLRPDVSADVRDFCNSDEARYRAALERIANADLKRTSAGYLVEIAREALK